MGIGDMLGGLMGGGSPLDGIMDKMGEAGIDLSALQDMDAEAITGMLEEKGIDLSMLEGLGISVEDVLNKIKGA